MKRVSFLFAIAAATLAAGCGLLKPDSPQIASCSGASCDVSVTVSGTPPTITLSDNALKMVHGQRGVMITWRLATPGYEFHNDSITPHTGAPLGDKGTTTQEGWGAQIQYQENNATQYKVKNKNDVTTTLYYDVKVYPKAGGVPIILDPAIFNDA
jgi:hypothetical protein